MTVTVDIECASWTRFLVGAIDRGGDVRLHRDPDALLDDILSVEGEVWAHNGGRYDWLWLIDRLERRAGSRATLVVSGGSVICVRIGRTVLRDSLRLVGPGMPLDTFAAIVGAQKNPLDLPCVCGRECGGYCSLSANMSRARWRRVEEYLANDASLLRRSIEELRSRAESIGLQWRATCGAIAWASAQRDLGLPRAPKQRGRHEYLRRALYGGRVEVYRTAAQLIERYDRNSSYPASLSAARLPVGTERLVVGEAASRALDRRAPGIYHATVDVPPMHIPPLPYRHGGRLTFPSGRVRGAWVRDELLEAVDRGARIYSVESALIWSAESRVFGGWPERIYAHRAAASDPAWKKWLKNIANSLVGKMAQHPAGRGYAIADEPKRLCDAGARDAWCRHVIGDVRECRAWSHVGGRVWATSRYYRIAQHAHVEWAAHVLADARLALLRHLEAAGWTAVYCDTDSVYATRPLVDGIGAGLGEWKHEGSGRDWRAPAPKTYCYLGDDGAIVGASKGVHLEDDDAWRAYLAGEAVVDDRGAETFVRAAAAHGRDGAGIFRQRRRERRLIGRDGWCGARIVMPDGSTRAPTVTELGDAV